MQPVITRPPRPRVRRSRDVAAVVAAALGFVAAVALLLAIVRGPDTVSSLTVDNPSSALVEVEVGGAGGGWMPLGAVAPDGSHRYTDIVDQGTTWRFRFTRPGAEPELMVVAAGALEADDWRVTAPQ